jgi:hypothetical protein
MVSWLSARSGVSQLVCLLEEEVRIRVHQLSINVFNPFPLQSRSLPEAQ